MKSIKVFLISVLLLLCSQTTFAGEREEGNSSNSSTMMVVDGATVSQVIAACAEYLQMTETYLHEQFLSFVSLGYNEYNEEYGTISFEFDDGPETYNWRVSGGSNVIVIWPT